MHKQIFYKLRNSCLCIVSLDKTHLYVVARQTTRDIHLFQFVSVYVTHDFLHAYAEMVIVAVTQFNGDFLFYMSAMFKISLQKDRKRIEGLMVEKKSRRHDFEIVTLCNQVYTCIPHKTNK